MSSPSPSPSPSPRYGGGDPPVSSEPAEVTSVGGTDGLPTRIVPLTLGWELVPRSVSVFGDTSGLVLCEPVPGVLIETPAGWVLLDTGYNTALIWDPVLAARFHGRGPVPTLPGTGDPLEPACRAAGVAFDDIVLVAVSHLHFDHAGGLKHFAGRSTTVAVQQRELDYGLDAPHPVAERNGIWRIDFDDPTLRWRTLDGDTTLVAGITAVSTPGHTLGHQSFLVELDSDVGGGGYAFAFDAADLTVNLVDELSPGGLVDATPQTAIASIRRFKELALSRSFTMVPGHDPDAWPELTRLLGGVALPPR